MLKLAVKYKEKLNGLFTDTAFDEKYKYYHATRYIDYELNLEKDSWNKLEFVSVDNKDNIIGFLAASINRNIDCVSSLRIINFYDLNYTFSKDFHQFLTDLFDKFKFNKVNFGVVIGNPAEKMYDKYIQKYGGNIAGYYRDDIKLFDGKLYDFKVYEIMRNKYYKSCIK